ITEELPYNIATDIDPVYIQMDGWEEDISHVRDYNELPETLRKYVSYIENETGIPVDIISVGPDRSETIVRQK
ncbi:MAG TPA: adenylosuccinate synthetase, partial [Bacteroidales bacterium]|nr:adenylosuccinate synthetase [Bacteroidales bacterium]